MSNAYTEAALSLREFVKAREIAENPVKTYELSEIDPKVLDYANLVPIGKDTVGVRATASKLETERKTYNEIHEIVKGESLPNWAVSNRDREGVFEGLARNWRDWKRNGGKIA